MSIKHFLFSIGTFWVVFGTKPLHSPKEPQWQIANARSPMLNDFHIIEQ
jgi:hypothetical protein